MRPAFLNILIVALLGMTCGPAFAQTSAPATRPARLPEPSSTTTADNTRYINNPRLMVGCQRQVAQFKDKPCDLIFIGDSITEGWLGKGKAVWDANYVPLHAMDFGIGGDKTQNVLWRLQNMDVQNLRPKVAVILIGTNNTGNSPKEIADGVQAVLEKTKSTFPGVKIILVSIMPNKRANEKMMAADALIKDFADDSSVFFLDLVPVMTPVATTLPDGTSDTNWKGLGKDHLHPDAGGYQLWADAMAPLLKKLMGGV